MNTQTFNKPITIDIFSLIRTQERKSSNNYRKMHGRPMYRKPLQRPCVNTVVVGMTGKGKSVMEKILTAKKENS